MNKRPTTLSALVLASLLALIGACHDEPSSIAAAERAVLAMTADQDRAPLTEQQRVPAPASQPNIVLIVADDLGWRDVGYHHSEIRTPVIDQLAGEGLTFNRFYVQPACSPTRAALLTGKSPMRLGILAPLSKNNPTGLPLDEETLAERLKSLGYQTALTGKWHLGPRNAAYHPNARGFDHFYGHLTGGVGYYNKVHGGGYDWQRNGITVRDTGYATELVANEAVDVIHKRDSTRPLFLYAAFGAPHLPNEAPAELIEAYADITSETRRKHAAMVTALDSAIGDIKTALEDEAIDNNTLIWFMSDNGGLTASNPLRYLPRPLLSLALRARLGFSPTAPFVDFVQTNLRDGGADNWPLSGSKQSVGEGGVRVPAFIYWPGQFSAQRYHYMATIQDVMPTLLEVARDTARYSAFDGASLWSALKTNTPMPPREYIIQTRQFAEINAVYRYPYKLIEDGNSAQLYDLEADPLERHNIVSKKPNITASLSAYLANFPRGETIALPLKDIVADPDYFGGTEDRLPWTEQQLVVD
ncbi:MAG: arylsulfatase [Pseudomonadota bacterium]